MPLTVIDINQFKLQPEPNAWEKIKSLGTGGFGEVALEKNTEGQYRALKKVRGTVAQDRMLKRELEILVEVRKSPELCVQSLGWYESDGNTHIALEYMDKGDLGKYLNAHGPQTEAMAKEITRQLLQGLEFLHKNNICHRDMKPENILIASTTPLRVKLTDFGASKITTNQTALHTKIGTRRYMAPELVGLMPSTGQNGVYTNAVDMWSLGCLVHQMITLKTPFMKVQSSSETNISETYTSETYTIDDEPDSSQADMLLMQQYCIGEIDLPIEDLKSHQLSEEGIQFVKDLLIASPKARPSATDAVKSRWISGSPIDLAEETRIQFQSLGVNIHHQVAEKMIQHWEEFQQRQDSKPKKLEIPELSRSIRQNATTLMHAAAGKAYTIIVGIMSCLIEPKERCFDFRTNGETVLELAAKRGHIEVAKLLLEIGANINATPPYNVVGGRTALQAAAESGNLEMVKFLLEKGANINARPSSYIGRGALQAATENLHYDIVLLLLQEGADVNLEPAIDRGGTALQLAAGKGELKLVELLLSKGAKVNADAAEDGGRTALQAAAGNGHLAIVETLLKRGAKVNQEPAEDGGRTALQAAAEKGHLDIVELLLKMGANVNAEPADDRGVRALAAAVKGKHDKIVELLRAAGAKS